MCCTHTHTQHRASAVSERMCTERHEAKGPRHRIGWARAAHMYSHRWPIMHAQQQVHHPSSQSRLSTHGNRSRRAPRTIETDSGRSLGSALSWIWLVIVSRAREHYGPRDEGMGRTANGACWAVPCVTRLRKRLERLEESVLLLLLEVHLALGKIHLALLHLELLRLLCKSKRHTRTAGGQGICVRSTVSRARVHFMRLVVVSSSWRHTRAVPVMRFEREHRSVASRCAQEACWPAGAVKTRAPQSPCLNRLLLRRSRAGVGRSEVYASHSDLRVSNAAVFCDCCCVA